MQENPSLGPHSPPAYIPSHNSHQRYAWPASSYPSSHADVGKLPSSQMFGSRPMHSLTDPRLRNSPYTRPGESLSRGMDVNNQDRPFKCVQCPQTFHRRHDLKRHERIHLVVKPFPCRSCDKTFSRKDALKVVTPSSEQGTYSLETYVGQRMCKHCR